MKALAASLAIVTLAFLGCENAAEVEETAEPAPESSLKKAPPLVLQKVDGSGEFSLAAQEGKVVLVDLWATWCAPCIAEIPHLQAMSDELGPTDFLMLGVVLESGEPDEIRAFVDEKDIGYLQVLGEEGTKESFGPFLGYPTKYLIDRDGHVVKRYFGLVGEELAVDVKTLIETGELETSADG